MKLHLFAAALVVAFVSFLACTSGQEAPQGACCPEPAAAPVSSSTSARTSSCAAAHPTSAAVGAVVTAASAAAPESACCGARVVSTTVAARDSR